MKEKEPHCKENLGWFIVH